VRAVPSSPGVRRSVLAAGGVALSTCAAAGVVAALRGVGPVAVFVEAGAFPLAAAVVIAAVVAVLCMVPSPRERTVTVRPTLALGGAVAVASLAYLAVLHDGTATSPPAFEAAPPVRVPGPAEPPFLDPPRHPVGTSDTGDEPAKPGGASATAPKTRRGTPAGGSSRPRDDVPVTTRPSQPRPPAPRPVPPPAPDPDPAPSVPSNVGPSLGSAPTPPPAVRDASNWAGGSPRPATIGNAGG